MWQFCGKLVNRLPLCFRHPNQIFSVKMVSNPYFLPITLGLHCSLVSLVDNRKEDFPSAERAQRVSFFIQNVVMFWLKLPSQLALTTFGRRLRHPVKMTPKARNIETTWRHGNWKAWVLRWRNISHVLQRRIWWNPALKHCKKNKNSTRWMTVAIWRISAD